MFQNEAPAFLFSQSKKLPSLIQMTSPHTQTGCSRIVAPTPSVFDASLYHQKRKQGLERLLKKIINHIFQTFLNFNFK
jgi:hypothetical protein